MSTLAKLEFDFRGCLSSILGVLLSGIARSNNMNGSYPVYLFGVNSMVFKLRFWVVGVLSFSLVLLSSVKAPLFAEVTQQTVPDSITACLPDQMLNEITYEGIAGDQNSGFISISVLPLQAIPSTPTGSNPFSEQPYPENPMPWRLVIAYNQGGCQALNTSNDPDAHTVSQEVRRQLALARVQGLIQESGGIENFMRLVFAFEGDEYHGDEIPEHPTLPADFAWAIQQMGIQIPAGWTIVP